MIAANRKSSCVRCRHYGGAYDPTPSKEPTQFPSPTARLVCRAFRNGIPGSITSGFDPHTEPVEGDNGIQFEPGPSERLYNGWGNGNPLRFEGDPEPQAAADYSPNQLRAPEGKS